MKYSLFSVYLLSINVGDYKVHTCANHNQIGQFSACTSLIHYVYQRQACRAIVQTIWHLIAMTLKRYAKLAAAAFYRNRVIAFGDAKDRLGLYTEFAFGDIVDKLLYNVEALHYFVHAHHVACKTVAFCIEYFLEVYLICLLYTSDAADE